MGQKFVTWKEAAKAAHEGKKVLFHHGGKVIPVDLNTTIQELQWKYFGVFGLSWHDVLHGRYYIVQTNENGEKGGDGMSDIKPGDIVEWTSQSQGVQKTKRGKVLVIVPRLTKADLQQYLSGIPGSRIKFEMKGFYITPSINDRAIVEVPRGGRSKLSDFYAPKLQWLKKMEENT